MAQVVLGGCCRDRRARPDYSERDWRSPFQNRRLKFIGMSVTNVLSAPFDAVVPRQVEQDVTNCWPRSSPYPLDELQVTASDRPYGSGAPETSDLGTLKADYVGEVPVLDRDFDGYRVGGDVASPSEDNSGKRPLTPLSEPAGPCRRARSLPL